MCNFDNYNVLVACEFSGIVRDAFNDAGCAAISCDIIETESDGPHYKGNVLDILDKDWKLLIAHPPCTYLCNSGVRWLWEDRDKGIKNTDRWKKMENGVEFFRILLESNIDHKCIENPIPHKYAVNQIGRSYDQLIQPYQFGHGETKATCLWLEGLPKLESTNLVEGREHRIHNMGPSSDRSKKRSKFFSGIAQAMADQWGNIICQS